MISKWLVVTAIFTTFGFWIAPAQAGSEVEKELPGYD
jgi:hypothetical protein